MIKQVTERPRGYKRQITHSVMFCDGCGKRLQWCVSIGYNIHLCEKCLKVYKQKQSDADSVSCGK